MTWTPLITSSAFTGMTTDVLTTASGILGVVIIVAAVGAVLSVIGFRR